MNQKERERVLLGLAMLTLAYPAGYILYRVCFWFWVWMGR